MQCPRVDNGRHGLAFRYAGASAEPADDDGFVFLCSDGRPFAGCAELQILGLGEGTGRPSETVRLRDEWTRWSRAAGFARFEGLNDW